MKHEANTEQNGTRGQRLPSVSVECRCRRNPRGWIPALCSPPLRSSRLVLAAGGQWMVPLAVQVPWFVLPNPCEVQPQGGRSSSGDRPVGHQLTLLCFSQIVPAAKLGNHALKWLFVQEMCGLKWSLTLRQSALVPSALHLTQGRWLVAGAGGDAGTRGPVAARWDPPGCSHGWECPAE